jgi:hypothetical protein
MSSVTNALAMGELQIAVAKQQLDAMKQEGKNALTLIAASAPPEVAAAAPPPNVAAGVGQNLNIVG